MHWRTTAWLTGIALALALFIVAFERPARLAHSRQRIDPPLLPNLDPASVVSVEIRSAAGSGLALLATNGAWVLAGPIPHPARHERVERLLDWLAGLRGNPVLTPAEWKGRTNAAADFGLSPATLTLRLTEPGGATEILLGSRSINGTQVFLQVAGNPSVYIADARVADSLSAEPDAWRDRDLLPVDRFEFDHFRVVAPGSAFTLARGTNQGVWEMTEPRPARADPNRVGALLHQLAALEIMSFIPATNAPPPEIAGLRPPRLSISFARGSNEVLGVALGAPLSNAPALFAQRPGEAELLVVPTNAFDLLRLSYKDLLDRRLLRFDPETIREVDVRGPENYQVVRQTNGWRLLPSDVPADEALVRRLVRTLAGLEVLDIAKEVVTELDLSSYGLAPPVGRLALRTVPGDTNAVAAVLETGTLQDNRIFARVRGEPPVYLLNPGDLEAVPRESWRLRDRAPWRFTPADVSAVTVRHQGLETTVRRVGTNDWTVPPGLQNEINPFALDEALHQLGATRALAWISTGETRAQAVGIGRGPGLVLELRGASATNELRIEFGKRTPAGRRYAATRIADGPPITFELPGRVCDDVLRELGVGDPPTEGP